LFGGLFGAVEGLLMTLFKIVAAFGPWLFVVSMVLVVRVTIPSSLLTAILLSALLCIMGSSVAVGAPFTCLSCNVG
jgi:hypothetical protein